MLIENIRSCPFFIGKTKYKFVSEYRLCGSPAYRAYGLYYTDIEEAAKIVDKIRISKGLQPVNGKFKKVETK